MLENFADLRGFFYPKKKCAKIGIPVKIGSKHVCHHAQFLAHSAKIVVWRDCGLKICPFFFLLRMVFLYLRNTPLIKESCQTSQTIEKEYAFIFLQLRLCSL